MHKTAGRFVAVACLSIAVAGYPLAAWCSVPWTMYEPRLDITNSDVSWNGNYFGLMPTLAGKTAIRASHFTRQDEPLLLKAIESEDACIAAHVILTNHFGASWQVFDDSWNELSVSLFADGTVQYAPNYRLQIQRRWAFLLGPR